MGLRNPESALKAYFHNQSLHVQKMKRSMFVVAAVWDASRWTEHLSTSFDGSILCDTNLTIKYLSEYAVAARCKGGAGATSRCPQNVTMQVAGLSLQCAEAVAKAPHALLKGTAKEIPRWCTKYAQG